MDQNKKNTESETETQEKTKEENNEWSIIQTAQVLAQNQFQMEKLQTSMQEMQMTLEAMKTDMQTVSQKIEEIFETVLEEDEDEHNQPPVRLKQTTMWDRLFS